MSITDFTYFLPDDMGTRKNVKIKYNRDKVKNNSAENRMGEIENFIAVKINQRADHKNPQHIG